MKDKIADGIFEKLKTEIIFNRLRPGDKIGEVELCEQFHVSRTPVRQALQRLEQLGLVEIRGGAGTFVTVISEEDVRDAYEIRCMAEKLAAKNALHTIPAEELDALEQKFLRLRQQLKKGGYGYSFTEMVQTDWQLHDLIMRHSGNRLLDQSVEKVTVLLRRCQFMYISQFERATEDHLSILRCLKNGDGEGLDAILENHLRFRPGRE